ncbi:MAG: hypothetical protein LBD23_06580, partial [Oscillospiraceae bacterium]|nr:hypothetical protein [Oscillospiraceae bacterium]
MLFYRIEVELELLKKDEVEEKDNKHSPISMQPIIETFYEKTEYNCHMIISTIDYKKQKSILCAAVRHGKLPDNTVSDFLKDAELSYIKFGIYEITLETYFNFLRRACRNDYIHDEDDVTDKLNITDLDKRYHRNNINYIEIMFRTITKDKTMLEQSKDILCDNSLSVELGRIFQGANIKNANGHPVHYILQSDNRAQRNKMLKVLLSALHKYERIKSRRYTEISFDGNDYLDDTALNLLYEAGAGSSIVVSYAEDSCNDSEHARVGADLISKLCTAMRNNRNSVLTFLCLPKINSKVKNVFMEHLGAITVVEICEENAFGDR